jgi:capsular polysaccharide biosynthesis protein
MLLAIAIGLVGGIGLAFVLDFLDDSLKSNEDVVRKLGLPVLGTLSEKEYQTCI